MSQSDWTLLRNVWWVVCGTAAAVGFAIMFALGVADVVRVGTFDWKFIPLGILKGLLAYWIIAGCFRRTSWARARHVRRSAFTN